MVSHIRALLASFLAPFSFSSGGVSRETLPSPIIQFQSLHTQSEYSLLHSIARAFIKTEPALALNEKLKFTTFLSL